MPSSLVMLGTDVTDASKPETPARSLVPREHGASMELAFPLFCAFALGPPSSSSIAYALAAMLAFLSHEALLVVLGSRGARQAERAGPLARRWLVVLHSSALLLGVPALVGLCAPARLASLVPVSLALCVLVLTLRGVRARTLGVELLAMVALVSVALPVALECGATLALALATTASWCVAFAVGTFAARGVLYRQKDGGRGLSVARVLGAGVLLASVVLAALAPTWWRHALAPVPFAVAALVLGMRPPPPTKMMAIGFSLVAASALTLALLASG